MAIIVHLLIGFLAYANRSLMMIYMLGTLGYFIFKIVKEKNKVVMVLFGIAYMTGAEVFMRMTKAFIFYETGKYAVILFSIMGIFYLGFKRNALPYLLYLLFLMPGVLVSYDVISFDADFRKTVLFNLSGPLCLCFATIFCYGRTISFEEFLKVLNYVVYPIIAMTVYVTLHTPDIRDTVTGTSSNAALSGGYGPNQVSIAFGLGAFILLSRLLIPYKNRLVHLAMMVFLPIMAYRALLTFSRGGVLVAIVMGVVFSGIIYLNSGLKLKAKVSLKLIAILGIGLLVWAFTSFQTGGMIENRYSNEDALGREKEDVTTGRADLLELEIENFTSNPIFGIGIGQGKFQFSEEIGRISASHNEITRMLSEHGLFGILALLTLIFAPIISIAQGRRNIYFWPFLIFWGLTIAHSAMRIAAPAAIYALCLLNIDYNPPKKESKKSNAKPI